jgi:TonB family protein
MSSPTAVTLSSSPSLAELPVPRSSVPRAIKAVSSQNQDNSPYTLTQIVTAVLWSACLLVGGLGFALPYSRPHAPALPPEPVMVEKLEVDLANDPLPPAASPSDPLSAPPPPSALVEPQLAPAVAVAEPSAVAFAVPVDGPTVVVAPDQATHTRPATIQASSFSGSASPQTLVFGQGEGRQPAPEYPARAAKLGQQGTVDVRLTVDTDGRVIETVVAGPCEWTLLNDAAERTVRHRWRFSHGPMRVYEVAIHFALAR